MNEGKFIQTKCASGQTSSSIYLKKSLSQFNKNQVSSKKNLNTSQSKTNYNENFPNINKSNHQPIYPLTNPTASTNPNTRVTSSWNQQRNSNSNMVPSLINGQAKATEYFTRNQISKFTNSNPKSPNINVKHILHTESDQSPPQSSSHLKILVSPVNQKSYFFNSNNHTPQKPLTSPGNLSRLKFQNNFFAKSELSQQTLDNHVKTQDGSFKQDLKHAEKQSHLQKNAQRDKSKTHSISQTQIKNQSPSNTSNNNEQDDHIKQYQNNRIIKRISNIQKKNLSHNFTTSELPQQMINELEETPIFHRHNMSYDSNITISLGTGPQKQDRIVQSEFTQMITQIFENLYYFNKLSQNFIQIRTLLKTRLGNASSIIRQSFIYQNQDEKEMIRTEPLDVDKNLNSLIHGNSTQFTGTTESLIQKLKREIADILEDLINFKSLKQLEKLDLVYGEVNDYWQENLDQYNRFDETLKSQYQIIQDPLLGERMSLMFSTEKISMAERNLGSFEYISRESKNVADQVETIMCQIQKIEKDVVNPYKFKYN